MTLDDVSDPKPHPHQPFLTVPRQEPDAEETDRDIFLIPAPPPTVWPRVFPGL